MVLAIISQRPSGSSRWVRSKVARSGNGEDQTTSAGERVDATLSRQVAAAV